MTTLNNIGQIALGILYGIYLAYFAPASQRQKAKEWYRQKQLTAKAQLKTTEIRVIAQPVIVEPSPVEVEDPWLLEVVAPIKVKQPCHATATMPLLLSPTTPCPKKDKSPDTIPEAIAQMTVVQLRKLCSDRDIKWRNARGGNKHLTKAQMIKALCTDKISVNV